MRYKRLTLHFIHKWFNLILAFSLISMGVVQSNVLAESSKKSVSAAEILQQMTPAEKVGELFLITLEGTSTSEGGQIYDLLINHHIGGVVLRADHNNFTAEDTASNAYEFIKQLQTLVWEKSNPENDQETDSNPAYVPLFVGISQEGNGFPNDQIYQDLTVLPSTLSIGATWSQELAQETGRVLGSELASFGFNLYLGPSLDVVDTSNAGTSNYSGTRTFGGDPYWVGKMGQAYIAGLHEGSGGKMTVVAKHFPGLGDADRSPDEEVPTVRKSLEQLKQYELAPFFAVTNNLTAETSKADGLMVSHIRYQGFQGNIRATTKPVSFDSTALGQLLSLEEFSAWRSGGGLMVSDNLGSRAVRRFFDPTGETFDAIQVARNAFLAGNDLLYLNNFMDSDDPDAYTTILNTLEYFVQKYQEDSVFAERVDGSVERIINQKLRIYDSFSLENVIPDADNFQPSESGENLVLSIARDAVTLISPSSLEIGTILPDIPSPYEYMVIFSDVRSSLQCTTCPPTRLLSNLSFQDALLRLYGSGSSNQIYLNRISSYTFQQLNEILNEVTEPSEPFLLDNLKRASWVVFNVLDINGEFPASTALKRILAEREDLLRDKHVVVFAMDTPFYLDATEISKVSAYYGLFSRTPEFVEVAARVLMQEIEPTGALPLSVSSVAYDLLKATSPDPDQIIPVNLVSNTDGSTLTPTPEVTEGEDPVPMFSIGESIQIAAGTILDHNHNPVPDGTVVRFTISVVEENVILEQQDATTTDGMARITYRIDRGGTLEVTAISEPAIISSKLLLNIERGIAEVIMPTPTLAPTLTPTLSPTITPQVTPTAEAAIEPVTKNMPVFSDWILTMLLVLAGVGITYMIGYFWWGTRLWGLRSAMCAALGGSLAYVLLSLGFPGLKAWVERAGTSFILQTVFIGLLLGWIAALIWWMIVEGSKPQIKRT